MPELEVKQKDDEIACKDKSTSNDDSTTDSFQEVLSRSAKKAQKKKIAQKSNYSTMSMVGSKIVPP